MLLSWPQIIHVSHAARITSGRWLQYNFYNVIHHKPLELHTRCPIENLNENWYYYCYDNYNNRPKLESRINSYTVYYQNKEPYMIYYPSNIKSGDCIVIRDEHPYNPDSIFC
jgi:hypothetical protein